MIRKILSIKCLILSFVIKAEEFPEIYFTKKYYEVAVNVGIFIILLYRKILLIPRIWYFYQTNFCLQNKKIPNFLQTLDGKSQKYCKILY